MANGAVAVKPTASAAIKIKKCLHQTLVFIMTSFAEVRSLAFAILRLSRLQVELSSFVLLGSEAGRIQLVANIWRSIKRGQAAPLNSPKVCDAGSGAEVGKKARICGGLKRERLFPLNAIPRTRDCAPVHCLALFIESRWLPLRSRLRKCRSYRPGFLH